MHRRRHLRRLHLGAEDVGDGGARDARARPSLGEEDAARVERVDGGAGVVHGVERRQHLQPQRPEHLLVGRRERVAHVVRLRRLRHRVELLDEEGGGGACGEMWDGGGA